MHWRHGLDAVDLFRPAPGAAVDRSTLDTLRALSTCVFVEHESVWRPRLEAFVACEGPHLTPMGRANFAQLGPLSDSPTDEEARAEGYARAMAEHVFADSVDFLALTARVLARLPVWLAEHTRHRVRLFGGGVVGRAWTQRIPTLSDARATVLVTTLDPESLVHELTHCFYDVDFEHPPRPHASVLAVARWRQHLASRGNPDDLAIVVAEDAAEWRAATLARLWVGP